MDCAFVELSHLIVPVNPLSCNSRVRKSVINPLAIGPDIIRVNDAETIQTGTQPGDKVVLKALDAETNQTGTQPEDEVVLKALDAETNQTGTQPEDKVVLKALDAETNQTGTQPEDKVVLKALPTGNLSPQGSPAVYEAKSNTEVTTPIMILVIAFTVILATAAFGYFLFRDRKKRMQRQGKNVIKSEINDEYFPTINFKQPSLAFPKESFQYRGLKNNLITSFINPRRRTNSMDINRPADFNETSSSLPRQSIQYNGLTSVGINGNNSDRYSDFSLFTPDANKANLRHISVHTQENIPIFNESSSSLPRQSFRCNGLTNKSSTHSVDISGNKDNLYSNFALFKPDPNKHNIKRISIYSEETRSFIESDKSSQKESCRYNVILDSHRRTNSKDKTGNNDFLYSNFTLFAPDTNKPNLKRISIYSDQP
jgi:hypothetical protein